MLVGVYFLVQGLPGGLVASIKLFYYISVAQVLGTHPNGLQANDIMVTLRNSKCENIKNLKHTKQ